MAGTIIQAAPKLRRESFRQPRLFPLFLALGALSAVSLLFVWSRLELTHLEYDLSRLNSDIRVARQEVKQLRIEAASLRHPKRIERLAQAQGLRMPTSSQIVLVK